MFKNNENSTETMENSVLCFGVGEKSPIIHNTEGQLLIISNSGFKVLTFMRSPTAAEVEEYGAGGSLTIRAGVLGNTMFWVTKYPNFVCDCTFCPNIVSVPPKLQDLPNDHCGYSASFILIDADTGIVKAIRGITLPNYFSRKLKAMYDEICDRRDISYRTSIDSIYRHTTSELSRMASAYCKIGKV